MARAKCPQVPLCAYADPLIRDLRKLIPVALKRWDPDAIHDARVATRRLRAAIDLVEPVTPDHLIDPLRKTLRRLRRRLGPLRDLDVLIDNAARVEGDARHGVAAAWLGRRLATARVAERRKTRKKETPQRWIDRLNDWQPVREHLTVRASDVQDLMLESLRWQWNVFADHADRLADYIRNPHGATAQDPHELRIAAKQLRYTLEMLAKASFKLPTLAGRAFKRMQNELGLWHDQVVLAECAMEQSIDSELPHHDGELQRQVLALATAALRRSQKRLERFARLWIEQGPALAQIVKALQSGQSAKPPRRGPDLFDSARPRTAAAPRPGDASAA